MNTMATYKESELGTSLGMGLEAVETNRSAQLQGGASAAGIQGFKDVMKIGAEQAAMQKAAIDKAKIDIATKYEGSSADGITPTDAEAEKGGALAKKEPQKQGEPSKGIDIKLLSLIHI